jgi:DNA-binding NarL/FixJ family response regulator
MKDRPADEIIGAFRRALNGEVAVSGELSSALIERLVGRRASPTPTLSQLSDRELQVFDLIGRGSTTREIAEKLEISIKTVETHLLRIRQKLGFKGSKSLHRAAYTWVSEGQLA